MLMLLKTSWKFAAEQRSRMVVYYLLFIGANVILNFNPLVIGKLVNILKEGGPDLLSHALFWSSMIAGITLFFWVLHGPARVIERRTAFHIYRNFQADLYRKIAALPLRWHQDHHSGDTINRVTKACKALHTFNEQQFMHIQIVTRYVVALVFLSWLCWWIGLVNLVLSVVIITVIKRLDRPLVAAIRVRNACEHHMSAAVFDTLSNIVSVLTLRLGDRTRNEIDRRFDTMREPYWAETQQNEVKWFSVSFLSSLLSSLILGLYIWANTGTETPINLGAVVAIFQFQTTLMQLFFAGMGHFDAIMRYGVDVQSVFPILADYERLKPEIRPQEQAREWQNIEIRHLNFAHHGGKDTMHHLRDVGLNLRPGQKIALIGSSGSGKSTLMTLLRGLYDAHSVALTMDGVVYDKLTPLAPLTTLVPQDAEIFENTILYNVTLGVQFPDDVVQAAMDMADFSRVAARLEKGWLTDIRERGVNLSGGEKQRLSLARGLLAARDSSILLLDEPTSNVDLATETVIFDRIFANYTDKTIVASIHRLHLLPRFDLILLIRQGRVAAQGDFATLLETSPEFQTLWHHHLASGKKG